MYTLVQSISPIALVKFQNAHLDMNIGRKNVEGKPQKKVEIILEAGSK